MSKIYVDEIAGIASADTVAIPGHVIQTVSAVSTSPASSNAGSYVDTGLSASITPTSTSSKILILCSLVTRCYNDGAANAVLNIRLYDEVSTELRTLTQRSYDYGGSGSILDVPSALNLYYSPNTTSQKTYSIWIKDAAGTQVELNPNAGGGDASTITLMEIAG